MTLSRQSIENLLDLVEIKLSAMHVQDREDAREMRHLEMCKRELVAMRDGVAAARGRRGRTASNVIELTH